MNCVMNGGAFLRANGDLVCWDDAGCDSVVQPFDPLIDYAADVYLGPVYNRIRERLADGKMPLPTVCTTCLAFNPTQPFDPILEQRKRLYYLQVESSFACQLRCPNCYPGIDRKGVLPRRASGHLNLKLDAFSKILGDLARAGVTIDVVEFQGHGEPLINKAIWEMIRLTRALFPETNIRIITNGNFDFQPQMVTSGVSEMIFSIDGVDQASYAPYRVSGRFEQAYAFMRDFCSATQNAPIPIRTTWKYILFDHCSSEAQLETLSTLAEEAGVDEVLFVITQMGPSSRRFFKALLDLRDRADRNVSAFDVLEAMQASASASWLSGEFRRHLGRSPFPASIADPEPEPVFQEAAKALVGLSDEVLRKPAAKSNRKIDYRSVCYLSVLENLDANLIIARAHLAEGRRQESGGALVSLATKLWRLYEARYDMLTSAHSDLVRQVLELLPLVPGAYQRETFLKLECFAAYYSSGTSGQQTLFAYPIQHLEADPEGNVYTSIGNDPCFILFSDSLAAPHGEFRFSFQAEGIDGNLENPRLYFDLGEGFSEADSVLLTPGTLRTCDVRLRLPPEVKRLRLDPGSDRARFRLSDIAFEPIAPAVTKGAAAA